MTYTTKVYYLVKCKGQFKGHYVPCIRKTIQGCAHYRDLREP